MQWWSACNSLLMQCIFCPNGWCTWILLCCPLEDVWWNKRMGIWFSIKCDLWESSHIGILFEHACAHMCVLSCWNAQKLNVYYTGIHENWRLWGGIVLYLGKYGNCAALCIVLLAGSNTPFLFSFMCGYVVNFVTWSLWGWHTFKQATHNYTNNPPLPHTHTHLA
jgi:hypothetical protein